MGLASYIKGLIGDSHLLELSYWFAGELVDVEQVLGRGGKMSSSRLCATIALVRSAYRRASP